MTYNNKKRYGQGCSFCHSGLCKPHIRLKFIAKMFTTVDILDPFIWCGGRHYCRGCKFFWSFPRYCTLYSQCKHTFIPLLLYSSLCQWVTSHLTQNRTYFCEAHVMVEILFVTVWKAHGREQDWDRFGPKGKKIMYRRWDMKETIHSNSDCFCSYLCGTKNSGINWQLWTNHGAIGTSYQEGR